MYILVTGRVADIQNGVLPRKDFTPARKLPAVTVTFPCMSVRISSHESHWSDINSLSSIDWQEEELSI